ncbi:MAG: hypothetical protein WCG27_06785, partial [Pseudomonadota bacterium]
MELNLLKLSSSENLNLLDWDIIVQKMAQLAYFQKTKQRFAIPPRALPPEIIEQELASLDFFYQNLDELQHRFANTILQIPLSFENFTIIDQLAKGSVGSLSDMNFIALLLESYLALTPHFRSWNKMELGKLDAGIGHR